jgi:hypothetical protein
MGSFSLKALANLNVSACMATCQLVSLFIPYKTNTIDYYEQQDKEFQQSLTQAREEIASGKVSTLEDLRHDLEVKERKETRARRTPKRS